MGGYWNAHITIRPNGSDPRIRRPESELDSNQGPELIKACTQKHFPSKIRAHLKAGRQDHLPWLRLQTETNYMRNGDSPH